MAHGIDMRDEATRLAMGRALRSTYEVDAPMPEHLNRLMEQLAQRLEERARRQIDQVMPAAD
jgi:hypothetical protein